MAKEKHSWIEDLMRNNNIVILITVVLMAVGVVGLVSMPRNEFPQFTIRQGVIVGVYPGASSAEVETQLTNMVENYIFGYQEIKKAKTYSYSREGMMYIFVELNDNVKNADQFWSKLKHGLDELKSQLPTGVLALFANSDFGDTSAMLITLSSDTDSYKDMEEQLKKLESECRKIVATSKIKHYGLQKEKIFVKVKPEKLNEYNIKTLSLLASYQINGMVNYASELKDGMNNLAIHLPANFQSENDLANQIIYSDPNNNIVRLKDIANIERRYDEPDNYIRQNGKKTILLSLEMQPGNNIVKYGKEVDKAIETFKRTCPKTIYVAKISELPKYVDDSVTDFMKEFVIAIVAVILVTMLLLPFRIASVAGITVPIAVMITLGVMYFFGIELNTVSLAALILVLGMIVDNSIVIIDNHVEKIDHRMSPWNAAITSAKELILPIITATLAICCSYIPLNIFVPGTAGEFIGPLPFVVCIALAVSIVVAVCIVPYLNFVFIKKGLVKRKKERRSFLDRLQAFFDRTLEKAMKHPKTVLATALGIIIISFVIFKTIDQQLFPEMERNQFAVEVYLPTGASIESTAKVVDSLETVLLNDKRVTNVTSFIGTSSPRFHTVYAPNMPAPNFGQLLINTISNKATREIVNEYSVKYNDNFENAHVHWKILAMTVSKNPIEIRISSDSIKDIRNTEDQVYEILKKTKHLAWVKTDWDQKQQNIRVNIDKDKANRMGFNKGYIATSMMTAIDGLPLTTIWEDDYPVQVKLSQETGNAKNVKMLEDQFITSPTSFTAVPLRSFATFSPEWSEGTITHRNGVRTLTISIHNDKEVAASRIFEELRSQIDELKLPEGTSINYGGEYEGQVEVFNPMIIALGLSIFLIFFVILFQFKKEKFSIIIMSTMLLGFPGAVFGLKLAGYPFSVTAFIGISSICGLIVRNGIILIDYARNLRETHKISVYEAALAAGKRRMRPIFLTSAAASVGVVPMIMSRSALWGPVGTVICFGLLFGMVLTLYVLPVLYMMAYKEKHKKHKSFWSLPPLKKKLTKALLIALLIIPFSVNKLNAQTSLSLDTCKALALENNYKIKKAASEVTQSEQVKKSAFTNYFPKVSAGLSAVKMSDYMIKGSIPQMYLPVVDMSGGVPAQTPYYMYFPGMKLNLMDYMNVGFAMASQPLFTGGRIYNGNRLAKTGLEISKQKEEMTTDDVLVRTEELYWTVISLNEKLKTLDSYMLLLDTLNHEVSVALKAGLIQRTDLLKVQLKQNELDVNRLKLVNGINLGRMALCQQIGIQYDSSLTLKSDPAITENAAKYSTNPHDAVINRNEYKMLENAVKAEELQKKMLLGEYMPQIAVGVAGLYTDVMDRTDQMGMAFATVSVPISDWWGGAHKLKESKARVKSAGYNLSEATELLELQITQANNELYEFYFQITSSEKSLEQASENLKVTQSNYKAGVSGMSDLLEAQAVYQDARNSLTEARCNYQIKKAKYLQSVNEYK